MLNKKNALVVVAIDFGTTYSAFAYSFRDEYKKNHSKIYSNKPWASDHALTQKTPTAILLDKDGKYVCFGYIAEQRYAELLEEEPEATEKHYFFNRFKMVLYQEETSQVKKPRRKRGQLKENMMIKDISGKEMKAMTVVSENIRYFKDKILENISVLTIPAIWKDNAKQFMRTAAHKAGIHKEMLSLAYEPEAAAIYMKEAIIQKKVDAESCSLINFIPGQRFMVLDCGGGTVDITSYEVQENSILKELHEPSGGPWGGTCVDREFINCLKKAFTLEVWEEFKDSMHEDVLEIEKHFEIKKQSITGNAQERISFSIPQSLYQIYSERNPNVSFEAHLKAQFSSIVTKKYEKLKFTPTFIEQFFSFSIDSITRHIRELLLEMQEKGNNIDFMLMVGGYSDSPLLRAKLRHTFQAYNVICAEEAVLAVVKGAVMFGHNQELLSEKICPRTYGIASNVPFDPMLHPDTHKQYVEGRLMCTDVFKVMARKGDALIVGKTCFNIVCNSSYSNDTQATVEIYESSEKEPRYTNDKSVKKIGKLIVPIPDYECSKSRTIRVEMHFGYTELFVTGSHVSSDEKEVVAFDIIMI